MSEKIVITGGSSGIGLAAAQRFAGEDYQVVITSRDPSRLEAALATIGKGSSGVLLDYTKLETVQTAFADLASIDHLVLSGAGQPAWGAFEDLEPEALAQAFTTKFWGYFHSVQAALPKLAEKGSITFISGAAARVAMTAASGVAAVNGAIHAMAFTLAKEFAPRRVNVVSPGITHTPAHDHMPKEQRDAFFQQVGSRLPVGHVAEAAEIADAIHFAVGNSFLTGAILDVDGGIRLG